MSLSWDPVRRGEIYCAPACGRGCKWAEYQAAVAAGAALAEQLGTDWAPRIWENLGWHYGAVLRVAGDELATNLDRFHVSGSTGYFLNHSATSGDPVAAACAVFESIRQRYLYLGRLLRLYFPHVKGAPTPDPDLVARPLEDWSEEDGEALWWSAPVCEPPYVGDPRCSDWPGDEFCQWWTPLPDANLITFNGRTSAEIGDTTHADP